MKERFDKFTFLISNINRYISKIKNIEMEELGLKGKQVQCLFHLYNEAEGISLTKLSKMCGEDKAAISRTVGDFEQRGYVYVEEDINKKYKNPIKLTKQGTKIAEKVVDKIVGFFALGSEGIEEKERESLYNSLTKILDNLQKICNEIGEKDD